MIRVCLVDDQTLVRQGVRSLLALSDDIIEVVGEAADGRQALDLIASARPDGVLMDMRMPVMSGLEALPARSQRGDLPRNILLTPFHYDPLGLAGIKAGARGYLRTAVSLYRFVSASQTVSAGGVRVQPGSTK